MTMEGAFSPNSHPFISAFRQPNLMEKLCEIPGVVKHLADPGFLKVIEQLKEQACDPALDHAEFTKVSAVGQQIAKAGHNDPRVMQVLMGLQGQGLTVEEKDLKRAEDFGDMQRREPVQLEQLMLVKDLQDPDEAKTRGNEFFKSGDFSAALAHYERGVELLRAREEVPAHAVATLLSNSAMCFLKLKWPDRAKKAASKAIAIVRQAEDSSFDQSKLFYRRAIACEQMKDFESAAEDMARALQQAKKAQLSVAEQHRLRNEITRLEKLKCSAEKEAEKKLQQRENEKLAAVQRVQGAELDEKKEVVAPVHRATDSSYLSERDFTHWARTRVAAAVLDVTHDSASGARITTTELLDQSKIQASITTKRGLRALYYDMDLHIKWKGKSSAILKPSDSPGDLDGMIRVYNIGHDTSFQLGGDENTSYMYQLGWDQRQKAPWIDELSTEAAELFDLVAAKVDGVIAELRKK
eukprot:TRINITY_DN4948_c1_g5_i1.p1 TRINITY_DN4948_c1_g5~~TRINITY_DN4948_c1_g5_i1.p1  ORF type:complete len:467 (-),score=90.16 TRINITY_DN4948_c1_g5_i1:309-1709(-)